MTDTLTKAVNGWNQAVGLLDRADAALKFLIEEMEAESKRNPFAFKVDAAKAHFFADAKATSRIIADYVAAQKQAR